MASNNGGGEEQLTKMTELSKTLKEGERILAPTRRPDGTLRKPIRIRAGYVPQEEVAIYQSKGALWKKEMASQVGPPGYDPAMDTKPKTKSAKRNERKKEKRLQLAKYLDIFVSLMAHFKPPWMVILFVHRSCNIAKGQYNGKNMEAEADDEIEKEDVPEEDSDHGSESVKSLTSQMTELAVSQNPVPTSPPSNTVQASDADVPVQDLDKKIRALKKKIRLTEAQQQKTPQQDMKPEQLEKFAKLEGWRQELKLLEDKKAELAAL
ncbi:partner of Y14 and mago isoform X1 [Herrania umbratica]|uniref:Partner of Y14 and mago isoform X1 n=1 Tax=Herrania umbratica TaxID=108875 RepID=A0A6J1AK36_9ROSI|nr:partner of Y14 and mago isoform X1 [Herrania umbratica]